MTLYCDVSNIYLVGLLFCHLLLSTATLLHFCLTKLHIVI